MMKRLMKDAGFPKLEEQMAMAREMGVEFIACTTSMGMMGLGKDAFIDGVNSFAGVATYLAKAREAKINLFI